MKNKNLRLLCWLLWINFLPFMGFGKQAAALPLDTAVNLSALKAANLDNYTSFLASTKPLLRAMSAKKVVGLAEGTHGTAEFYRLRTYISRFLVEEKGFNYIAFEDDLSAMWLLDAALDSARDVKALMKAHMMAIWQNRETLELLEWVKGYNQKHKNRIHIVGLDYPVQSPDVEMLSIALSKAGLKQYASQLDALAGSAAAQDAAWFGMNDKDYKMDWKQLSAGSKHGYLVADSLEKAVAAMAIAGRDRAALMLSLMNLKQGFEPFYREIGESARDSIMAYNVSRFLKGGSDKMLIWAHGAHLGKAQVYGGTVGGTGKYILKHFPDNYFVLGTTTATGEVARTLDARVGTRSLMSALKLEQPVAGSWEALLGASPLPFSYGFTTQLDPKNQLRAFRFVGYGGKSGAASMDRVKLAELYDALLFIRVSHVPARLD